MQSVWNLLMGLSDEAFYIELVVINDTHII